MDKVAVCLEDAYKFYEEAPREFEEGVREGNRYKIRDAAEKAWNAVVQASNAVILKLPGKTPSSHWERRRMLRGLEAKFPEAARPMLRDR